MQTCTSSGSLSSRSMLVTWLRLLPTIFALDILDDRELERLGVADIEDDDGNFVKAGALRGPPAPFAGDDLKLIGGTAHRPHRDRRDDAALLDRGGELVEFGQRELT